MYCTKCGAELPQGSKFCPKCGTATDFSTVPSKETTLETHENSNAVPPVSQTNTSMPSNGVRCPKCGASGCTPHYKQNISGGGYGCLQGGLGCAHPWSIWLAMWIMWQKYDNYKYISVGVS